MFSYADDYKVGKYIKEVNNVEQILHKCEFFGPTDASGDIVKREPYNTHQFECSCNRT